MQAGHTAPSPEVVQAGSHSASSKGIREHARPLCRLQSLESLMRSSEGGGSIPQPIEIHKFFILLLASRNRDFRSEKPDNFMRHFEGPGLGCSSQNMLVLLTMCTDVPSCYKPKVA